MLINTESDSALCKSAGSPTPRCVSQQGVRLRAVLVSGESLIGFSIKIKNKLMAAVSRRYLVANFCLLRAVLQYVVSMESGLHAVLVSAK